VPPVNPYGQRKQAAEKACRSRPVRNLPLRCCAPRWSNGPFGELWTTSYINEYFRAIWEQLGRQVRERHLITSRTWRALRPIGCVASPEYPFSTPTRRNSHFNEYLIAEPNARARPLPGPTKLVHNTGCSHAVRSDALGKYVLEHNQDMLKMATGNRFSRCLRRAEANLRLKPSDGENPLLRDACIFSALRAREVGFERRVSWKRASPPL